MGVPLAEAWVRVRAKTDDVRPDTEKAFRRAGDNAGKHFTGALTQHMRAAARNLPVDRLLGGAAVAKAAQAAGKALGDGVVRDAADRLRDGRGRFVRAGEEAGEAAGDGARRGFAKAAGRGKGLGDTGVFARVLATSAAKATLLGGAAGAAAPAVLKLAGALAPAAGAAIALPAAFLGAAAAIGTFKLAVRGVGPAIEAGFGDDPRKAAEALKALPPEARKFASAIIGLKSQLAGLRTTVSNAFFAQFNNQVAALGRQFLPMVAKRLPEISAGLGGFVRNFIAAARTGTLFNGVNAVLAGTARGLHAAAKGAGPLTNALGTLLSTGAPLLERMGAGFATLATRFNAFIQNAAKTGQLAAWMEAGIATIKTLFAILGDVIGIFRSLFAAAQTGGNNLLLTFRGLTKQVNDFLASAQGMAALRAVFSVLSQIGQALRTALAAVLPAMAQALKTLGPTLGNLATAAGQFIAALAPVLPVLAAIANTVLRAVIPAFAAAGRFLGEHRTAMLALVGTLGVLALAWKAAAFAIGIEAAGGLIKWAKGLKVVAIATKLAAAAQWLFNIATAAFPVTAIILGVVALVAAIILAYKHSARFREVVQAAWRGIQQAVDVAWNQVIKPALAGLAWFFRNVVAPAALWLWRTVLAPAFANIGTSVKFAWEKVIRPALAAWVAYFRTVIAPVAMWLWKTVLGPAFRNIGTSVTFAWNNVIRPAFAAWVAVQRTVVGPTVLWLWRSVIVPAFRGIGIIVSAWWAGVRVIFGAVAGFVRGVLAPVFTWLWRNIIGPAFTGIGLVIKVAWALIRVVFGAIVIYVRGFLMPIWGVLWGLVKVAWAGIRLAIAASWAQIRAIFGLVVGYVRTILLPVFTWLWQRMKAIWNGIFVVVQAAWARIRPVFSAVGSWISSKVVPAFRAGVSAIGNAWDRLRGLAERPVQFVVSVLNRGIIGPYNRLAGVFGAPRVSPIVFGSTARNFGRGRTGGHQEFAAGGRIPGAPSRRDNRLAVGPGGLLKVATGEFVTNAMSTAKNLPLLQAINRKRGRLGHTDVDPHLDGMAEGGIIGGVRDIWDVVSNPARFIKRPAEALINRIPGGGTLTRVAGGMARKVLRGLMGWIGKQGGGLGGGKAFGWRRMQTLIRMVFPALGLISGFRPGSRTLSGSLSYHALGRAVDYPPSRSLAAWIKGRFGRNTRELITPFQDLNLHNGRPHTYTGAVWNQHNFAGGNAHVHWAMAKGGLVDKLLGRVPVFDMGGVLPPGISMVDNRTGGYEHLKPAGRGEVHHHYHMHNHGVIGSQKEQHAWFVKTFGQLKRERRLPGSD